MDYHWMLPLPGLHCSVPHGLPSAPPGLPLGCSLYPAPPGLHCYPVSKYWSPAIQLTVYGLLVLPWTTLWLPPPLSLLPFGFGPQPSSLHLLLLL
jgi:hypothetical protein